MGYLDNDTVIVDAILTKHGRKLLAEGAAINPSHFALSDDGVLILEDPSLLQCLKKVSYDQFYNK